MGASDVGKRRSQWLRGVLDLCLLAVVADEPAYGYEMVQRLSAAGLDAVAEGSIYPALGRLQREGLLESFLVESAEGPARKYYRPTAGGRAALAAWSGEWERLVAGVAAVLNRDAVTGDAR
ncbi:PadR family transcriptional regulator [Actinomadura rayongensis]|uniref:PadR family transcriptional regulator n=1 Tax=Actinomadura rayongensis TaxID=1429076 RepID=A0A6I4VWR5_9ACTN|nr:PadR family transcriptional regulator [Actinomadura rayongensis]MXQ62779.1 PadR family transcriptional regulator [Actinomadura rayongensis]